MIDANLNPPALEASCQSTSKLSLSLSSMNLLVLFVGLSTLLILVSSQFPTRLIFYYFSVLFSFGYSQLQQSLTFQCGLSPYRLQNPEELLRLPSM